MRFPETKEIFPWIIVWDFSLTNLPQTKWKSPNIKIFPKNILNWQGSFFMAEYNNNFFLPLRNNCPLPPHPAQCLVVHLTLGTFLVWFKMSKLCIGLLLWEKFSFQTMLGFRANIIYNTRLSGRVAPIFYFFSYTL